MKIDNDILKDLGKCKPITQNQLDELGRAGRKLNKDPKFQTNVAQNWILSLMLHLIKYKKISRAKLAKKN